MPILRKTRDRYTGAEKALLVPVIPVGPRSISMQIFHFLFCFSLLTSSFDLALVVNVGGTVRASQVALLVVCFGGMIVMQQKLRFISPIGFPALVVWGIVQTLFLPFSSFLIKGVTYNIWLWYNIVALACVVQLYYRSGYTYSLVRFYVGSFGAIAVFGLYQFVAPLTGLPAFLVTQFWLPHLARINGFSYEPSYFATYMLLGWVTLLHLLIARVEGFSSSTWKVIFAIETIALVLSSSRTAWLFMSLEAALRIIPVVSSALLLQLKRLSVGKWRVNRWQLLVFPLGILMFMVIPRIDMILRDYNLLFLLSGTGLQGTTAHSVDDRAGAFSDTLQVFRENPFIGRSLGGVSPSIAALHGFHPQTMEESKEYEGLSVFAEVLASSGLIGIIPFLIFLYQTTVFPRKLGKLFRKDAFGQMLLALCRAMTYGWLILQLNQNILRPYVWLHLTIICVVAANLEFAKRSMQMQPMLWNVKPACDMTLSPES
ncbi:hypothetical protein EDE15_1915 [Edaphobacter aggregans]|uniref:O-antigen ligase-like membrane protein n=2 Tax=Edaphobacter aggregans TaxID=570835 RepID=A0A3R9NXZ2_9BACT|nr:hypothetical protein EDE15_1915 [Edaphobacter aggregans]